ncbi:hypothetical protein GAO43_28845 [Bacteroides thetaiotaomicron]|jgi:hypothetical protein|uniref:Lipocalin-like domain-containing protein n=1 Tax=Bacteroides thetaiotaomicron TaxID=818 RepID=A0A6I0MHH8_BACT4|nr:hypothetical protein [Bacteroides thetaiotaomicron]KAB4261434.1 hypothetical protein GAO47_27040 [Bacteroides thetaiotaomicron]KAB4265863.1 hypothetical protein GAO40_28045 [Bacteroides thetaiotaomicron]KAB4272938.1 hypothetical protein GAO35_28805 [Bacteroides thetaiotaomicron]KAB4279132.1 hypothetical protein GAO48_28730 [Bacteroides thetaiotaomicron]KAB4286719.1 hypothetical protein GAO45_16080 [Bacteroides thetaiotaomicron]
MKQKMFYLISILLLGMSCITSCSGDDDEKENLENNFIEINNVKYSLGYTTLMGGWYEDWQGGDFTVSVNVEEAGVTFVYYYKFDFDSSTYPQKGDEFSTMNLTLKAGDNASSFYGKELTYESGSATVINTNKSESEITIQFKQLKMANESKSYTFNGIATLMFSYEN